MALVLIVKNKIRKRGCWFSTPAWYIYNLFFKGKTKNNKCKLTHYEGIERKSSDATSLIRSIQHQTNCIKKGTDSDIKRQH